jgi:hypothetical protein
MTHTTARKRPKIAGSVSKALVALTTIIERFCKGATIRHGLAALFLKPSLVKALDYAVFSYTTMKPVLFLPLSRRA